MAKNSVNGGIGNRSKTQERKRSKKRIKSRKCGKFMIFSMFSFGYSGRNLYPCSDFVTY